MRALAAVFAIGIALLSPASVRVSSTPLPSSYSDHYWVLMPFKELSACVLMVGQEPRGSATNRNLKLYVSGWFKEVRLELPEPPAQYFQPGKTTMVSVDLGPTFKRSLEFRPSLSSVAPALVSSLTIEDLDAIRASLVPSQEQMSVRFESGESWRFPTPEGQGLAPAAASCWYGTGIAAGDTRSDFYGY